MSTPLKITRGRLWIAAVGLALLAGCASQPTPSVSPIAAPTQPTQETAVPEPTQPPSTGSSTSPLPTPTSAPAAPQLSPAASLLGLTARQDLARRLNVSIDEVQVIGVDQNEMAVGTLGCGETGGRQNTGLIIGYEITLNAGGQDYVYHSDGTKLVPCSPTDFPGAGQSAPVKGASPTAGPKEQVLAVADLAQLLGVAPSAITVVSVVEMTWPDASLGCPKPGMMYAQVLTSGYRIVLEADGKTYEYHTGSGRVVPCP